MENLPDKCVICGVELTDANRSVLFNDECEDCALEDDYVCHCFDDDLDDED